MSTNESVIDFDEVAPTDAKAALVRIRTLLEVKQLEERGIADIEDRLKQAKARLLKIDMEDLPTLIRESGFESVTLEDGTKVAIVDELSCSVAGDRKDAAISWLRGHDGGAIVKTNVGVSFGRGTEKTALRLFAQLAKRFDEAFMKEDVHNATLKALIKEREEQRAEWLKEEANKTKPKPMPHVPPDDLFGIYRYTYAKVTAPKLKK